MRLARPRSQWLRRPSMHSILLHIRRVICDARGGWWKSRAHWTGVFVPSDARRDETNQQEQRSCETLLLPKQLDLTRQMVHYGYNPEIDIGRWTAGCPSNDFRGWMPDMTLTAMISSFARRQPFWSRTANRGCSELDEWPVNQTNIWIYGNTLV